MGNAVSGCCQTVCDSSDGAPPPWLSKSSTDELGDAIDRKFPRRRGMGAGATAAASADAACQPGFIEKFHHGGGVFLFRVTEEGLVVTEETQVPKAPTRAETGSQRSLAASIAATSCVMRFPLITTP